MAIHPLYSHFGKFMTSSFNVHRPVQNAKKMLAKNYCLNCEKWWEVFFYVTTRVRENVNFNSLNPRSRPGRAELDRAFPGAIDRQSQRGWPRGTWVRTGGGNRLPSQCPLVSSILPPILIALSLCHPILQHCRMVHLHLTLFMSFSSGGTTPRTEAASTSYLSPWIFFLTPPP